MLKIIKVDNFFLFTMMTAEIDYVAIVNINILWQQQTISS